VTDRSSGALLGWNGLQHLPETDETEIGFLLDREQWDKGRTTEAARVAVRFAFETLEMPEIIAVAHPDNGASRRVIEKLGMTFDRITEYFGMPVARYAPTAPGYRAQRADST
jgi:ribosomal-protein-alanine N-acetyltransferase